MERSRTLRLERSISFPAGQRLWNIRNLHDAAPDLQFVLILTTLTYDSFSLSLLAVVNVDFGLVHAGEVNRVGDGFAVGRNLVAIDFRSLSL